MAHFTVTAIGSDQPGIVAAVSEPLARLRCNIEDAACSILRGHFTMMLIVDAPAGLDADRLRQAVEGVIGPMGVAITVAPIDELDSRHPPPNYVLSVYGADHPGIVAGVSRHLADRRVNITDLQTRLLESGRAPIYAMILELQLPDGLSAQQLEGDLAQLRQQLGVDITLRELETDAL